MRISDWSSDVCSSDLSVVVSLPQRVTPLLQAVLEVVRSGRLGTINQVQAFNYVNYGGVYFGQWYRYYATTGGLWLQNRKSVCKVKRWYDSVDMGGGRSHKKKTEYSNKTHNSST